MDSMNSMDKEWKGWKDFLGLEGDEVSDSEFMGDEEFEDEEEED
tara:strand:+ start:149 stop:280 length:132 start_codon:yes stop_codon:yes gene_type:complete